MTTNTTNIQAASIDTREFRLLLADLCEASEFGPDEYAKARVPFIAYIDAKLAESNALADKAIADVASLYDQLRQKDNAWDAMRERAEKAESRLAEIQRGVEENLQRYRVDGVIDAVGVGTMEEDDEGEYVLLEAVRTLFDSAYVIGQSEIIELLRDITKQCGASEMYYIPGDLEDRVKDMLAKYDQNESKP